MTETVEVPAQGEFLVKNGEVLSVVETDLTDSSSEYWSWTVYTEPRSDDD